MKKFFSEFKTFITRGNVVDMAVGVIVGSAFTAIVNGLSNYILKPIINWILALILGKDGLSGAVSFLSKAFVIGSDGKFVLDESGNKIVDLANSIYIDWGAFISTIINFLLIAFTLFIIVRVINKVREGVKEGGQAISKGRLTREQKKELKAAGINRKDKEAVKAYFEKKEAEEKAKAEQEQKEAEEKARLERLENPTTEDLLKDIRALLRRQNKQNKKPKKAQKPAQN